MKGSEHDRPASGHGKFWVGQGVDPEFYTLGPFDDHPTADAEGRGAFGTLQYVVGVGEEVDLSVPDADQIFDHMRESAWDQCSEVPEGYLSHHDVTKEQKDELTAAVEKTIADWLTRHNLWPTFCAVTPVDPNTPKRDSP